MFSKVLVANRGEIAVRILRTLDRMGIASVAVYSEPDRHSPHVELATEALALGGTLASESYLLGERLLTLAESVGVSAIHPGYGFLSENADFAEACSDRGMAFIGPKPSQVRQFGLKHLARDLAHRQGIPLLPGTTLLNNLEEALGAAEQIGYPVMLKSTAGGGGIGLRRCWSPDELATAYAQVQRLGQANFREGGVFLEKYIPIARHVEVQIFGDGQGRVVTLGERDCSSQRRNQKVIEETPAPGLAASIRRGLAAAAQRLGAQVQYQSAGTVEFIVDGETGQFYFLEVNTRLQVEHGVTELVCGLDLVEWMVRLAAGERDFFDSYQHQPQGHAIQARIYAEDPHKNHQPSAGVLTHVDLPATARWDAWVRTGTEVTPFYDPLLAKAIVQGATRSAAIQNLQTVLAKTTLAGIATNLEYLQTILASPEFQQGNVSTSLLANLSFQPQTIDVLVPGTFTTVQDYPGRVGYWAVGVPPSGPMDHLAFRWGNRLLGNPLGAAGLECTMGGPTLRFNAPTRICLTGAGMRATLDGQEIPYWRTVVVPAGGVLALAAIQGAGYRTYITVQGGFPLPEYLGSRATFTLGQFGGHGGRTLRAGDVLPLAVWDGMDHPAVLPPALLPQYAENWEIGVMVGPHGAPDFFTPQDMEMLFTHAWGVHHNSARTGIRLIGPKPAWARTDGGEAGLHPSNIHDNAYAIGTIDFTGDMPIILGYDGPSLGGFVCPATIVQAELWKIGQLKPGDRVRFVPIDEPTAQAWEQRQEQELNRLEPVPRPDSVTIAANPMRPPVGTTPGVGVTYRQAGDKYVLIEYGALTLDLNLRFRVHGLMTWLQAQKIPGIVDLTPGIRSLQVHYDNQRLPRSQLLEILATAEANLPDIQGMEVPSRIVHLPLSWNDASIQLAISKYMQSVRPDAPWCPSNLEFIQRVNGLDDIQQVYDIVFGANYLVLGLGDVYLGAPVATPLDPRQRLVTTKYNPARTWTPENAVGIGGAYLCIYGMEGPGGYQLVGRTVPVWNRYYQTADFEQPWLLRFFDQIRFFPVTADELKHYREDVIYGRVKLEIHEQVFSLRQYQEFLQQNAESIHAFKTQQQNAFNAERERWAAAGEFDRPETDVFTTPETPTEIPIPPGHITIRAEVSGTVWQVVVNPPAQVNASAKVVIIEAMKTEIDVLAPGTGTVTQILCQPGQAVTAGQILGLFLPSA
ncbi:urea carboxylase [Gloeomargarita lithophora Alchichica-D10]|uniref:Urea carboxylase n=1 Tax=Gloeomargarita lithophora Alchichica-D10 TaxID=1188229 RepID=A0A1J0ADG1_9CYAN|nr:urea carboxylase [Gloeomargarita lithophora]APB33973.1 urea carboxylase [Gloeomargarita lithophora Alchichica-D10]